MKKDVTELVFIIDRSGSMHGLEDDTIGGFNAMLQEQQQVEGDAVVTTVLFDDRYELLHNRIDIRGVAPLTRKEYTVGRQTALLDAIGKTIHNMRKNQRHIREEHRAEKVLFVIITDGYENASRKYTASMIRERITHQKKKYGWEFMFLGANMDAVVEADKIGISPDWAYNYSADSTGTAGAYQAMSFVSTAVRTAQNPLGFAPPLAMPLANCLNTNPNASMPELKLQELRAAVKGFQESSKNLISDLRHMQQAAKQNGGKIPNANDIVREVLGEEFLKKYDK